MDIDRIPYSASSRAHVSETALTAALDAAYSPAPGIATHVISELKFTSVPVRLHRKWGRNAFAIFSYAVLRIQTSLLNKIR
jgi:hypothetical protein